MQKMDAIWRVKYRCASMAMPPPAVPTHLPLGAELQNENRGFDELQKLRIASHSFAFSFWYKLQSFIWIQ